MDARASGGRCNVVVSVGWGQHGVDDVDDAVAGHDIGGGDRRTVHHDGVAHREGKAVAADGCCCHAVGHVSRRNGSGDHVRQQDVRELRLAVDGVEGGEVNAGISKGLVGGSEERERSFALEGLEQFGLNHSGDQRVVDTGALCGSWNVVGVVHRHEHLVDDVDDAVAGHHVSGGDRCAVDHHGVANGEGEAVAVGCLGRHAVRYIGGWHRGSDHVSEEDVTQRGHAVGGVKSGEVDAGIGKGLVGRGEEREGPLALQSGEQVGLNDGRNQGIVNARASSRRGDVAGCIGGHEHLVDDVDDAVAGRNVRSGDRGPVDGDRVADAEGQRVAVDGRGRHAVRDVGRRHGTVQHVVEQDVR